MPSLTLWIVAALAVVVVAAVVWWLMRRSAPPHDAPSSSLFESSVAPASAAPARRKAANVTEHPLPPALAQFHWTRARDLASPRREVLMSAIGGIPRPPRNLQKLLSSEFFENAGSVELSELVMSEPLIAAKVLATVNAPVYGLQKPVTTIEPAVTFLGMDAVRSICLQYMLAQAFKPELASSQQSFDVIWHASAIASELCLRLGKMLNMPEQGTSATKVVLVFVGHLTAASLLPRNDVSSWLGLERIERAQLEQEVMGLTAGEIGSLLLKMWKLPPALLYDISATSRVLVTPSSQADMVRIPFLGLAYLCVRLGERLALGKLTSLEDYDVWADNQADTFHLRTSYLTHPALNGLATALRSAHINEVVQYLLGKSVTPHTTPALPSA